MSTDAPKQKGLVTNRIILLGAILTLGNLAEIIHKSSRVYLFQQALCLLYYKRSDPTKIQSDFSIDENFCKVSPVQSRLATIDGIDSFLSLLPREFLTIVSYIQLVRFNRPGFYATQLRALIHSLGRSTPRPRNLQRARTSSGTAMAYHPKFVL